MQHHDQLKRAVEQHPYPLLFATISGAHLYGFPSPDSDYDLRGVHLLPAQEVVGLNDPQWTIERSNDPQSDELELDLVTHDLKKFIRLMLKRNGYVLEQLYSPLIIATSPEHEELKALGRGCITRHHVHHYLGFANNQWRLFEKENPPRVKPLLYVYRVLLTGIHLMQAGEIEANLLHLNEQFRLPYIDELVLRKTQGEEQTRLNIRDVEAHRQHVETLLARLKEAGTQSTLPEAPSMQPALNDLLIRLRLGG